MTQYIDKAAVVAEIERLIDEIYAGQSFDSLSREQQVALWYVKSIMSSIHTLEVKEVDFEKELDRIWFDNKLGNYFDNDALDFAHVRTLCKHFFELGIKVNQKGE